MTTLIAFAGTWGGRVVLLGLALFFLLFLLLHLLVLVFSWGDRPLDRVRAVELKQPDGTVLATYDLLVPGADTTVIFVHGTPATGAAFNFQMAHEFPGAHLITYDRPGFGNSPGSDAKANLDYQAQALIGLIDHAPTDNVILVGHSYGGPLVLKVAALRPDRVSGVAMIGGSVSPLEEHPWTIQYFGAWPLIRSLIPDPLRSSNVELLGLKHDLLVLDREIPQVRCPVLMIQGNKDDLVPDRNVPYLQERFAAFRMQTQLSAKMFPTFNHFMMWEQPAATNQTLADFVETCRHAKSAAVAGPTR